MKPLIFLTVAALGITALPATNQAEELALDTVLLAWAYHNCDGFDYPEDLMRNAAQDVVLASETEQTKAKAQTDFLLTGFDTTEEACDYLPIMLEAGEDE